MEKDDIKIKNTGYSTHFKGVALWDDVDIDYVVDFGATAEFGYNALLLNKKRMIT